jgi:endonuclease/exonuclease/phosphatase family metal-dependent hydrolase
MHASRASRSDAQEPTRKPARTRVLRLVTYNIAHARGWMPHQGLVTKAGIRRNLDRIAEVVRGLNPDLVALQEIDSDSLWNGRFDHVAYLSERTGLGHAAFGASNDVAHASGRMRLCYGNALLSRHPIVLAETRRFGNRRLGEKGMLYTEVDWNGSVLPVVSLHLHHSSRAQRLDQSSQMLDLLERRLSSPPHMHAQRLPVIVAGDFNCAAHRREAPWPDTMRFRRTRGPFPPCGPPECSTTGCFPPTGASWPPAPSPPGPRTICRSS